MTEEQTLWLEDFSVGQSFPGATSTCTEEAFLTFARLTGDAHPIHYDAEFAARTRFGRPLAHGLLVASYSALGATPLSLAIGAAMVAMLKVEFRFRRPVFAGDTLTSHFTVEDVRRGPGKPDGVVEFAVQLTNDRGEAVMEGRHSYLIRARDAKTQCGDDGVAAVDRTTQEGVENL